MKNLITISFVMMIIWCGKSEVENRKLTAEEEMLLGSYEADRGHTIIKHVFLKMEKLRFIGMVNGNGKLLGKKFMLWRLAKQSSRYFSKLNQTVI